MAFYFKEITGDKLMTKINLRKINLSSKQWDHPMKGLLKCAELIQKDNSSLLELPKKYRETYCISLLGLSLIEDTRMDWWINIPDEDPPDGIIMTLLSERDGFKIHMREIEVVEHREEENNILKTITAKLIEKSYQSNIALACLVLTPGIYDFLNLSLELKKIKSTIEHVFIIFAGIPFSGSENINDIKNTYTVIQILPTYEIVKFNHETFLDDFKKIFENGQESRIINGDQIYFATSNKKFHS